MEINTNFKVRHVITGLLGLWIVAWVYFAIFNWDIFIVSLNINMGFGIFNSYPFVMFFLLGILIILSVRYLLQYSRMLRRIEEKEKNNKIAMQEKDIEILKLKEMILKEQTSEFNHSAKELKNLHDKIDEIAKRFVENTHEE